MYNTLSTNAIYIYIYIYIYICVCVCVCVCIMYCWLLLAKYYKGGHRKENEMGKKCGTHR